MSICSVVRRWGSVSIQCLPWLCCLNMHRIYSSNILSGQIRRIFVNRQLKIFKIPHQHQHSFTETDATAANNIEQPIVQLEFLGRSWKSGNLKSGVIHLSPFIRPSVHLLLIFKIHIPMKLLPSFGLFGILRPHNDVIINVFNKTRTKTQKSS